MTKKKTVTDPFDQLLISFLTNPEQQFDYQHRACLSLRFSPELWQAGLLPACSLIYSLNARIADKLQNAQSISRNTLGLTAVFDQPPQALDEALKIHSMLRHSHGSLPFALGLTWGVGIALPDGDWMGIPRFQAERLASLGGHHELLASDDFLSQSPPPPGVGSFRAHRNQIQGLGFEYWVLRDYRMGDN